MNYPKSLKSIIIALLIFPLILLIFGSYHGFLQVLYRSGALRATDFGGINYYQGLTAHGVINAILLTTFFAVAFGHVLIFQILGKVHMNLAKLSAIFMFTGSILAAWAIFTGRASVLYTFYPPLKAHPIFYIGLTVFVVGSWMALWSWIKPVRDWRSQNKGKKIPLAAFGILVTFILWQICTLPVAVEILVFLIPWSLNFTDHVNVVMSRTLFWFFGHALVYFWLLPAYVMYYTVLPRLAGGKTFSDFAGRFTFLILLLFSTPLGLHHQFTEPGISANWKAIHTVLTAIVALPSMVTAFSVAASLEFSGLINGGHGLFGWWKKLPYFKEEVWLFPYLFCGLLIFIFGGATGVVNGSYSVNQVVHNTAWIPAHFHLTVAGPVFLAILGMSLFILIGITGKKLRSPRLTMLVPYIWMIGVFIMSAGLFIGGLRGEPRRTNMGMTYLNPNSADFRPEWVTSTFIATIGGTVMTLAVVFYFYVLFRSLLYTEKDRLPVFKIPLSTALHDENIGAVNVFKPWIALALVLAIMAYAPPLYQILKENNPGGQSFTPDNPLPTSGAQK
ncbi:MAG: cbb3-type cytochrome c oxidase subunit I [Pseudobdellovibrionaceae bacterium]